MRLCYSSAAKWFVTPDWSNCFEMGYIIYNYRALGGAGRPPLSSSPSAPSCRDHINLGHLKGGPTLPPQIYTPHPLPNLKTQGSPSPMGGKKQGGGDGRAGRGRSRESDLSVSLWRRVKCTALGPPKWGPLKRRNSKKKKIFFTTIFFKLRIKKGTKTLKRRLSSAQVPGKQKAFFVPHLCCGYSGNS